MTLVWTPLVWMMWIAMHGVLWQEYVYMKAISLELSSVSFECVIGKLLMLCLWMLFSVHVCAAVSIVCVLSTPYKAGASCSLVEPSTFILPSFYCVHQKIHVYLLLYNDVHTSNDWKKKRMGWTTKSFILYFHCGILILGNMCFATFCIPVHHWLNHKVFFYTVFSLWHNNLGNMCFATFFNHWMSFSGFAFFLCSIAFCCFVSVFLINKLLSFKIVGFVC